ncbi:hypothetical protein GCM10009767_22580 [Kocuria aegyptia]|uniref:Uncharacterized protein n=1 Tax=Kocuria aegyptia TaxID=330943 RepID=A0ABN2KTA0_9MICC
MLRAAWADHMSPSWAAAGAAAMVRAPRARVGTVRSMDLRIRFSPVSYRGSCRVRTFDVCTGSSPPDGTRTGGEEKKLPGAPQRPADPSAAGPATNSSHGDRACVDGTTRTRCGRVQIDTALVRAPGEVLLPE